MPTLAEMIAERDRLLRIADLDARIAAAQVAESKAVVAHFDNLFDPNAPAPKRSRNMTATAAARGRAKPPRARKAKPATSAPRAPRATKATRLEPMSDGARDSLLGQVNGCIVGGQNTVAAIAKSLIGAVPSLSNMPKPKAMSRLRVAINHAIKNKALVKAARGILALPQAAAAS